MSRNPLASKLYNNFILRLKAERDLDIYRNKFEFTFNELKVINKRFFFHFLYYFQLTHFRFCFLFFLFQKLRTYITEHFSERKLNVEILEKINLLIKHNELEVKIMLIFYSVFKTEEFSSILNGIIIIILFWILGLHNIINIFLSFLDLSLLLCPLSSFSGLSPLLSSTVGCLVDWTS